jgi:hypothetical protein
VAFVHPKAGGQGVLIELVEHTHGSGERNDHP